MLCCTGVRDWTAIFKSLYLVVLAAALVTFYGSGFALCQNVEGEDVVIDDLEGFASSDCRLSFFDSVTYRWVNNRKEILNGHVYIIYYVIVWAAVLCLSVFGFILMFVKCGLVVRRVYAFCLFGAMGLQITGDVVSLITSWSNYDEALNMIDDGEALTKDELQLSRGSYLGLQIVLSIMSSYVLAVTAYDTFDHSDQSDEEQARKADKQKDVATDTDAFGV